MKRRRRVPPAVALEEVVYRMRLRGYPLAEIAIVVGLSEATICRVARRLGVKPPRELRGLWRMGRRGATPGQILAHAKPENAFHLLRRHGHVAEAMRRQWVTAA